MKGLKKIGGAGIKGLGGSGGGMKGLGGSGGALGGPKKVIKTASSAAVKPKEEPKKETKDEDPAMKEDPIKEDSPSKDTQESDKATKKRDTKAAGKDKTKKEADKTKSEGLKMKAEAKGDAGVGQKKKHACQEVKVPFTQEEAETHIAEFMEKNNRPFSV